jgi:segregation and condensation protein B
LGDLAQPDGGGAGSYGQAGQAEPDASTSCSPEELGPYPAGEEGGTGEVTLDLVDLGGEPAAGGPAEARHGSELGRAVEAVLMVADSPVEPGILAQLLEVPPAQVERICAELAAGYAAQGRGFVLTRVAGGYRFQSHPDMAPYIERFVLEGQQARLSAAALETLAIVAYKQPVSRAQVSSIRGVSADGVLRTLCQRGYVTEVGRDPGPGQAVLYGTTALLLERLGIDRIEDLPPLGDFVPGPEVMDALEQGLRPGN